MESDFPARPEQNSREKKTKSITRRKQRSFARGFVQEASAVLDKHDVSEFSVKKQIKTASVK